MPWNMSVMMRPRMPILTVQYWRMTMTAKPTNRHVVTDHAPALAI